MLHRAEVQINSTNPIESVKLGDLPGWTRLLLFEFPEIPNPILELRSLFQKGNDILIWFRGKPIELY
jgi:hypothetical protein